MEITFENFINEIINNPILIVVSILVIGLMIVNGETDSPNAIATCISTRAVKPKSAVILAIIFEALGIIIMSILSSNVASTMMNIANFGDNNKVALVAICTGIISAIIWALVSTKYGIPSSESHALIAGISGAAIAINNSFSRNKF